MKYSYEISLSDSNGKQIVNTHTVKFDKEKRTAVADFKYQSSIYASQFYMFQFDDNDKFIKGLKTTPMPLNLDFSKFKKDSILEVTHILDLSFLEEIGMIEKQPRDSRVLESALDRLVFDKSI